MLAALAYSLSLSPWLVFMVSKARLPRMALEGPEIVHTEENLDFPGLFSAAGMDITRAYVH